MKVQDIMTADVKSCSPEANLAAISEIMFTSDYGMLPVVNDRGSVNGLITDRDICIAVGTKGRRASDITVGEVISGEVFACAPDDDVRTALETMQKARVRRLPVIDREGGLLGILSMSDMVRCAEKNNGKKSSALSCEEVVKAYRAICEGSVVRPDEQQIKKTASA